VRVPRLGCSAWRRSRWAGPFNAVGSWRGREGAGFFGSVIALDLAVVTSGKCNINAPPLSRRAAFCAKGKGDLQHRHVGVLGPGRSGYTLDLMRMARASRPT